MEGQPQIPWQQSSCTDDGLRTCYTGGFGHWPTMRMLTRRWTELELGTGKCGQQRATNSCAASALSASLTLPNRVSLEGWHHPHSKHPPLPLLLLSLFSPELMDFKARRVSSFRKNLIELAELELKHAKVSAHHLLPQLFCCSHLPTPQDMRVQ